MKNLFKNILYLIVIMIVGAHSWSALGNQNSLSNKEKKKIQILQSKLQFEDGIYRLTGSSSHGQMPQDEDHPCQEEMELSWYTEKTISAPHILASFTFGAHLSFLFDGNILTERGTVLSDRDRQDWGERGQCRSQFRVKTFLNKAIEEEYAVACRKHRKRLRPSSFLSKRTSFERQGSKLVLSIQELSGNKDSQGKDIVDFSTQCEYIKNP